MNPPALRPFRTLRPLLLSPLALACGAALAQEAAPAAATAAAPTASAPAALQPTLLPALKVKARKAEVEGDARHSSGATRMPLSLQDTPSSVSVIDGALMRDFGMQDVNRLLDLTPGVLVERVETDRVYYTARGFDITQFQQDGLGMPFANGAQWGRLDTAPYERVEVLRGATGLLAGTGNPSATVNFVRKRASSTDLKAEAQLTLGSWNQRRLDLDVGGRLVEDGSVRGRLVLVDDDKDSYLDRYHSHRNVAYGVLEWDIGRDTLLSVGLHGQRSEADSPMWGALPLIDSNGRRVDYSTGTSTAADWSWWNNRSNEAFAELSHTLGGGWQTRATLTRRHRAAPSELLYVYGTPDASGASSGLYGYPSAFDGRYVDTVIDAYASGPLRLAGRTHTLMAGINLGRQTVDETSRYPDDTAVAVPSPEGWDGRLAEPSFTARQDGSQVQRKRHSVYAAMRLDASDDLKVSLGLNASRVRHSGQSYGVDQTVRHTAVKPFIGAVLDLDATYKAYASYAEVFNPQIEADVNRRPLDALEGSNLEAGVKAAWLQGRLDASAAVFRTRQRNVAVQAGYHDDWSSYYRGIDATSTGYELELRGRPVAGWHVSAGWTHLQLRDGADQDVNRYMPRRSLRLTSTWDVQPRLKLGTAVRWQSRVADATGTVEQKAYGLVDLSATWTIDRQWNARLALDNVANVKYLNSLKWDQAYYGEPRSVKATVSWTH
ncbi:MAG: hypothetical protein RIQ53_3036 [Pseudomonadota bacterium]